MPTDTKTPDPNIIKLENVRLSFPQLWTARAMQDKSGAPQGKPKFSATYLMDNETHAALIARIEKTIDRVALEEFKKKVTLKHKCLHDGNEMDDIEGYGDGITFLRASSLRRPAVVDRQVQTLAEEDGVIYAGCYVNATVRIYAMSHDVGGKQVNAELRAIQFVKDGESFGAGKVDVESEFDSLEDEMEDI